MRIEQIGDATLYLGDCLEILPTLPKDEAQSRAIVTDPTYGIEPKYFDIACERIDNAYRQKRMFA